MSAGDPIRASGGVIWRPSEWLPGKVDVVLVHRPSYDDWSLPKGKAEGDESDEDAARREVREETGLEVELGKELPSTRYLDRYAKPKVVRYWTMTATGGELKPSQEVDIARWLPYDRARQMLSYERDHAVLDALPEALGQAD
ncbi:MAG: 8-oxo-dGTP diphosphatase [Acidimicrobiaceae bacterium]|nr:8-oxo-dGTP diphosphatase [Acidimicrobiaceae bacterium]